MKRTVLFLTIIIYIFLPSILKGDDFKFSLFSAIEINSDKNVKNIFGSLNIISFCEALPGIDNILKFGDVSILPYIQFNIVRINYQNSNTISTIDLSGALNNITKLQINSNSLNPEIQNILLSLNNLKKEITRVLNSLSITKQTTLSADILQLKYTKIRNIYIQIQDLKTKLIDIILNRDYNADYSNIADAVDELLVTLEQFSANWSFDYYSGLFCGLNIELDLTDFRKFRNHNQTLFIGAETNLLNNPKANNSLKIGFKIKDAAYSDKLYGLKINNIFTNRDTLSYGIFGGSQIFKY